IVPMVLPVRAEILHGRQAFELADLRIDGKAERFEELQRLVMGREVRTIDDLAELIAPEAERTLGRDARVLLTQASSRRVAWIDEQSLTRFQRCRVERLEAGDRHVDLAPNLEHLGNLDARGGLEPTRDDPDGLDVGRHILTHTPVAASGGLDERTTLVPNA